MELAPRYCRSCGSRILVKNVCHNCNNDPLKGDNYCYDCGALTPNAESCLQCGARYKTNFPVKQMLLIAGVFIAVIAATAFFMSRPGKEEYAIPENNTVQTPAPVNQTEAVANDNIVNIPDTSSMTNTVITDTTVSKPSPDSTRTLSTGVFSAAELAGYNIRCSYFLKKQRSQVLFFISNGSGFIKINDKVHSLARKRKGVDEAVFGGSEYEATVRIDGLGGSEKEWLASCTLIVKDILQHTSSRHKVYSSCIEL